MAPTPYKVSIPESSIEKLKQKLELTTWPDELDDAGWNYGAPMQDVKKLAEYWQKGFDWRKQESKMNELPQYQTKIEVKAFDPVDLHFVHQRSDIEGAIPLLFVHGWPGNFTEVAKLLPLLVKGGNGKPAFHVVAPSLPNFGFSSGVKKPGFNLGKYAETFNNLMHQLGYSTYVTQGGDWGYYITRCIGLLFPESCKSSHINMVRAVAPKFTQFPLLAVQHQLTPYTEREKKGLKRSEWFINEGSAYRFEQGTKPQTLGYSLADSPVGLLAWIYEKLRDWVDAYPWTDDEILTWVSIYWFSTAGPAASLRIYYEATHNATYGSKNENVHRDRMGYYIPHVKLGLAHFPRELSVVPQIWGKTMGDVVVDNVHESGGHFAAHEKPEEIYKDLVEMYQKGGPCYGIIKNSTGY